MEALVKKDHQENLVLTDIAEPVLTSGTVKIAIKYAGICGTDVHILKNEYRHETPIVLGHEFSGIVTEVSPDVDNLSVGDRVVSLTTASTCGKCVYCISGIRMLCKERRSIGTHVQGVFTQSIVIDHKLVIKIPDEVSYEEAALTEPLACVVHGIMEMTRISAGDLVYISGPGTIGLFALQVAKAEGANVVVAGIDNDKKRLELANKLGANHLINLNNQDPKKFIDEISNGSGVDMAVECAGVEKSAQTCLEVLKGRGKYHQLGLFGKEIKLDFDKFVFKEILITTSYATTYTSFQRALLLMADKKIDAELLISGTYPLREWREAFKEFERKDGLKVLLYPEQ